LYWNKVRRIEKFSDAVDLIRNLEDKYVVQEASISSAIFSRTAVSNEVSIMIDMEKKDNFIKFLSQVKNLGIIKLKFNYILISLVCFLNYLLLSVNNFNLIIKIF